LSRWVEKGISDEELKTAQRAFVEDASRERSDDWRLAMILAQRLQFGRTIAWDSALEARVKELTAVQVNEAIQRNIDLKNLYVAKAGDFKAVPAQK
jgi:zinc protease